MSYIVYSCLKLVSVLVRGQDIQQDNWLSCRTLEEWVSEHHPLRIVRLLINGITTFWTSQLHDAKKVLKEPKMGSSSVLYNANDNGYH